MIDIVDRLSFDATRCEVQFSKGVAANIKEGIAEIERLRAERDEARRSLWLVVYSNGGYELDIDHAEDFPGLDCAWMETATNADGNIIFHAFVNQQREKVTTETK